MSEKKIITWQSPIVDFKTSKTPDVNVNDIHIDSFNSTVQISLQTGARVELINSNMEELESIGFINFDALNKLIQ